MYSQADLVAIQMCKSFVEAVLGDFRNSGHGNSSVSIVQWVCSGGSSANKWITLPYGSKVNSTKTIVKHASISLERIKYTL